VKDATGSLLFYEGMVQDITERKRVEEALKESEKLLRESQVMAGLGSYALDITTGTWKSSVVLDDIFGIDAHFIRSVEGWASLIHPEHRESLVAYLTNEVIGKSTRFDKQYSIVRHNDRQERWVHGLGELEFDAQHRPIKMIGTIQDITERKLAEEALRESEKKLKALFEALPVGVSILDAERRIAYINPALEKILGITKDGLIRGDYKRRKYLRSDNTQMLDEEFASMRAIREQRAVHDVETGVVKEDGHVIWTNVNAVPVAFPDWQVVIVTTDITERKQGEEALKSSEEWQRAILGASLDGIVVEDEEMIVFANDAFARLYGYKNARELVGKHVSIVQSHEDSERMLEYGARRMRGEQVPAQYEFKGKRKDGTAIDVEASVSTATIQGQQHVITVVRDITMRKQAEEKLRQLSLAVEQSPTSIVITDTHGAIEYVNAKFSQISGYAFEEVQGENSRILKSGETSLEEYKHLWDEITSGREWRGEFHNRRKNGDLYWESASISPITNADGKIAHFLAVKEDITERKALEHQLRQVQKLESIGTLAGGIAHDFNNILGIIIGHAGLLRRLGADPDRLAKSVDAIHTAVERGAGLARQILTFARKTDVLFEPVLINDLVTEIVTMMGETFPKTITIEHRLEPNIPSVNADRTQIHQTLLNLCVNARDAMPGSGTVSIATARVAPAALRGRFPSVGDADYLCMSVSDTGMGMDEATKQRIFEPFFTTKEKGKGTGLGLAVVYGIMQSHDGFIDVKSAPGKGTTFSLYFPIPFHREMVDKRTEPKLEDAPGGSETLLIIEDEEMLRQLLRMVLEAKGYKVLTAADGEEGLAMYQLHRREITLILSDIGLPKLGGDDVFLNLKRLNPKVKVILASGYIDPEVKSRLIEAGANIFIQKPYVPYEILKSIREEIERRND
jgi:PAS domain S-box-containing protein